MVVAAGDNDDLSLFRRPSPNAVVALVADGDIAEAPAADSAADRLPAIRRNRRFLVESAAVVGDDEPPPPPPPTLVN